MNEALCIDCMEYMKTLPDNAFDLAVVDPPYGDALEHTHTQRWNRFGERFDRYKTTVDHLHSSRRQQERENAVTRTGGTWAEKYGKKSLRGM